MIDNTVVSRIKESLDITSVISEYITLKKVGQNYHSLCPFHNEKTPSFTVNQQKQIYYCFGCGAGGDLFSFVMKIDGLLFQEALKRLADKAGVEYRPIAKPDSGRLALYTILQEAAALYKKALLDKVVGLPAREYLARRGITRETIELFGIGFAPSSWDFILKKLGRQKSELNDLLQVGLVVKKNSGNGYYDRFRNRVVFPIADPQGKVVAFGARVIDDTLPKYLNSPETPVFSKSKTLFGLDKLQKKNCSRVLFVEGYLDQIMARQHGIDNCVATLGTAITESHFRAVKRIADEVVFLMDGDAAGQKASERALLPAYGTGIKPLVVTLPDSDDPDSFLGKYGRAGLEKLIDNAKDLALFVVDRKIAVIKALPVSEKNSAVEELVQVVAALPVEMERHRFGKYISEQMDVPEDIIGGMLDRKTAARRRTGYAGGGKTPDNQLKIIAVPKEEEIIVHLLLHNLLGRQFIIKNLDPVYFSVDIFRQLITLVIKAAHDADNDVDDADMNIASDNDYPDIPVDDIYRQLENNCGENISIISRLIVKAAKYDDFEKEAVQSLLFIKRKSKKEIEKQFRQIGDNPEEVEKLQRALLEIHKIN